MGKLRVFLNKISIKDLVVAYKTTSRLYAQLLTVIIIVGIVAKILLTLRRILENA